MTHKKSASMLFATFGSLGDLHPVIALALGMQRRGHRVAIATMEGYREKISALGLGFHPLRPNISLTDEAAVRRVMNGPRGAEYLLRDMMLPAVRDMHGDLMGIVRHFDVLVTSELVYAAPLVAAQTRVPWVSYALAPLSYPSTIDPSIPPIHLASPWLRALPRPVFRALLNVGRAITWPWWRPLRELRRQLGLPPGGDPFFEGKFSPRLDLALFSPVLQPLPADAPPQSVQTGFPFFDENEAAAALPARVAEFLAAGEPPVVFTLGSSAVNAAGAFYTHSAAAAQSLGRRALLLLGKNAPPPDLPPSILAWDYLPYARIFPYASAIVHQGGVGTTAQALRAGRPMLVMPFAFDQPDNAARVTRLGVGRTISRRAYRPARVARELNALLCDPGYAHRARDAGERVRAEDGVRAACDAFARAL
jgi:rhamnosyltransferase subunit B